MCFLHKHFGFAGQLNSNMHSSVYKLSFTAGLNHIAGGGNVSKGGC
jgi:hypothetical protein